MIESELNIEQLKKLCQYRSADFRDSASIKRTFLEIDPGNVRKKDSRFADKEDYIPLDLWDSTPDAND